LTGTAVVDVGAAERSSCLCGGGPIEEESDRRPVSVSSVHNGRDVPSLLHQGPDVGSEAAKVAELVFLSASVHFSQRRGTRVTNSFTFQ